MKASIEEQIDKNQALIEKLRTKRSIALEDVDKFEEAKFLTDIIIELENNQIELKYA